MSFSNRDLVDCNVPQVLELGFGITSQQVALLDLFDQIPADVQVPCHIADGHAPRQLQHEPLEGLCVAPSGIGEGNLDLAYNPTNLTFDARDGQDHGRSSATDRQGPEAPLNVIP